MVCLATPPDFYAVGQFYGSFPQVDDDEVRAILAPSRAAARGRRRGLTMAAVQAAVSIIAGDVALDGALVVPEGARGIVLFAHGSGSSRKSPAQHASWLGRSAPPDSARCSSTC